MVSRNFKKGGGSGIRNSAGELSTALHEATGKRDFCLVMQQVILLPRKVSPKLPGDWVRD